MMTDLRASLFSMRVIGQTKDAVYLRLPEALQEPTSCNCDICKANPDLARWDTLAVPLSPDAKHVGWNHSWRVHCPDARIRQTFEYLNRK